MEFGITVSFGAIAPHCALNELHAQFILTTPLQSLSCHFQQFGWFPKQIFLSDVVEQLVNERLGANVCNILFGINVTKDNMTTSNCFPDTVMVASLMLFL